MFVLIKNTFDSTVPFPVADSGLRHAMTEKAKEMLRSQLPATITGDEGPVPELLMVRLSKEDVGTRVIPVVGNLSDVSAQVCDRACVVVSKREHASSQLPDPLVTCQLRCGRACVVVSKRLYKHASPQLSDLDQVQGRSCVVVPKRT